MQFKRSLTIVPLLLLIVLVNAFALVTAGIPRRVRRGKCWRPPRPLMDAGVHIFIIRKQDAPSGFDGFGVNEPAAHYWSCRVGLTYVPSVLSANEPQTYQARELPPTFSVVQPEVFFVSYGGGASNRNGDVKITPQTIRY